jgi:succinoglycan biosynthesis protein ExoO
VATVAIASFNAEAYLEAAVRSALGQSLREIEILIVDDLSTDSSPAIAERLAAEDSRVRFERLPANRGPAGARNCALELARGEWFVILDSDDLFHPERLSRLISRAVADGADLIADELILFADDWSSPPQRFLRDSPTGVPEWVSPADYFRRTVMYGSEPNLGFLKPVIRLDTLRAHGIRYDEGLRIAEDDDLVVRMLLAGMRYRVLPEPGYFYRKHSASISHRLSQKNIDAIVSANDALTPLVRAAGAEAARSFETRARSLRHAQAFTRIIDSLKARRFPAALGFALANPGALPLMRMPVAGLWQKAAGKRAAPDQPLAAGQAELSRLIGAAAGL